MEIDIKSLKVRSQKTEEPRVQPGTIINVETLSDKDSPKKE
jgi:hypothetical protein